MSPVLIAEVKIILLILIFPLIFPLISPLVSTVVVPAISSLRSLCNAHANRRDQNRYYHQSSKSACH